MYDAQPQSNATVLFLSTVQNMALMSNHFSRSSFQCSHHIFLFPFNPRPSLILLSRNGNTHEHLKASTRTKCTGR